MRDHSVSPVSDLSTQYHSDVNEPYAALDLGSNSFHLIVARDNQGAVQIIDRHREMVRLGEGLSKNGYLCDVAITRAIASLERISQRLRTLPDHNVHVVGTNALRVAENREVFLEQAEKVLGHPVNVISGREEARLIYSAVSHSIENRQENRLVIDIGGGSTELIVGSRRRPNIYESLQMGCITLTERWFKKGGISKDRLNQAIRDSRREIEVVQQSYRDHGWDHAVGTSGSLRAIQNAIASFSSEGINLETLDELGKKLIEFGNIKEIDSSWCSPTRALSLPGGFAIAKAAFKSLELDQLEVSSGAMREGLLYELLDRAHHEDVREESVQNLLERYQLDYQHANSVAETALLLFDQIHPKLTDADEDNRQVLRWSALLHEIGLPISHTAYHKHGAYLIKNMDIPGFSLNEQSKLSTLILNHRRSLRGLDEGFADSKLVALCLLLRLAVLFKRSRSQEDVPQIKITLKNGRLNLCVPENWLDQHPLTRLSIDEEVKRFAETPFKLVLSG